MTTPAPPQEVKPNFTGKWILDVAKSDFGPYPPPESIVQVVEHKDPKLRVATTSKQKDEVTALTNRQDLTTDGKENTNKLQIMGAEQEVKSIVKWNGDKLSVTSRFALQGTPLEFNDTWALSEGGKVLTLLRIAKTPEGEFTLKTVYNKQ